MWVRMRAVSLSCLSALAVAAGCLAGPAPTDNANGATTPPGANEDAGVADLATTSPPDMADPVWDLAWPKLPPDLASTDLAGYTNCFNAAICNATTSFCIKYHTGTPAMPGAIPAGPSCYEPADCSGTAMNCACITQDAVLGANCKSCADHLDGTYDCYAMQ
jgi:hypothetical protein